MRSAVAAVALCGLIASGCQTPAATPVGSPVLRGLRFAPILPDAADRAAADLVVAALVSNREAADRALECIEAIDAQREAENADATGLAPLAADLHNAAFLPERAYLDAAQALLDRNDLPRAARGRLRQTAQDDPLALANARMRDARLKSGARLFNALSEPIGRSVLTTALAPYHLGQSLVAYAIEWYREDALPLQRRQALAHWKEFLARYPEAPESRDIAARVKTAEKRWHRTLARDALEEARDALAKQRPREALHHAEVALRHRPDDTDAEKIRGRASREVALQRDRLATSLHFAAEPRAALLSDEARALSLALLAPGGDVAGAARALPPESPLSAAARFALASARGEAGEDAEMWQEMRALARDADEVMARHARSAVQDVTRNPYDAFRRAQRRDRLSTAVWVLLGPAAARPRFSVDGVAEWLLRLPGRVQSIALLPVRVAQLARRRPPATARITALHAARYLSMHGGGARSAAVRDWLEDYERARENWLGALRVAASRADAEPDELEALRERAARQAFEVAAHEQRRDLRNAMLHNVAREFADTRAGRDAGLRAREEIENLKPHHIRISRGFLEENPDVAGPEGLGIEPQLLDDDPSNGELHPDGVALIGGRELEFSFLAVSGDEDDAPERRTTTLSDAHLARLVARLEEASFRNALVDRDDPIVPDAERDLVFERARLGLTEQIDTRATAEADYTYRGVRERYGMVRGREAILPFDIVVQGSLADFSLGAFPRMRTPRETPDAFLYR